MSFPVFANKRFTEVQIAVPQAAPKADQATALKADKFLLIVHGTVQEVEKAKDILIQNKAEEANVHEVTIA